MKKLITILFLVLIAFPAYGASEWVQDPSDCPATDETDFPGQSCNPVEICGDDGGTAQCYDTSSISYPAGDDDSNTNYSVVADGGYLIDCFATADGGAPYCDNGGDWWCDRNSTCYTTNHKDTTCLNGGNTYECGDCRSAYQDCDETAAICEVQTGVTAQDNDNTVFAAECGYACASGYQACEGDAADTEGCLYETGVTACDAGGGEPGVIGAGCSCTPLPQEHFITNTLAEGYGSYLLYGQQNNDDGWLMNLYFENTAHFFRADHEGNVSSTASFNAPALNTTDADISGDITSYWGSPCTNQFITDIADNGTFTCATVDIGDDTNLAAGRSLTLSGDSVEADAELYTDQSGFYVTDPVTESASDIFWFMNDVTITYVWCKTDTGTVDVNLEDGSDNNILSSELVCDAGGQTSCASGCDVDTINGSYDNITAKTESVDYDASASASSPTELTLYIGYTIDD